MLRRTTTIWKRTDIADLIVEDKTSVDLRIDGINSLTIAIVHRDETSEPQTKKIQDI